MKEITDRFTEITELIDNGSKEDFLEFAKQYDLSKTGTTFYNYVCDKIRQRLDREGLSHETIRPE